MNDMLKTGSKAKARAPSIGSANILDIQDSGSKSKSIGLKARNATTSSLPEVQL